MLSLKKGTSWTEMVAVSQLPELPAYSESRGLPTVLQQSRLANCAATVEVYPHSTVGEAAGLLQSRGLPTELYSGGCRLAVKSRCTNVRFPDKPRCSWSSNHLLVDSLPTGLMSWVLSTSGVAGCRSGASVLRAPGGMENRSTKLCL